MEYPFVKCLHPVSILNPYTQEPILVECGKCRACRVRKGAVSSMKCKLESLSHKYCMFITLTYSRYAIPLMNVESVNIERYDNEGTFTNYIPKSESDRLVELCPRLGVGTILGTTDSSPSFIKKLKVKSNTNNLLPHLSKRDIQLFIKRLRKYISKYDEEKIRYYAVGEYGPIHYRPHYHLLLWFSSEQIYKIIRQAVFSCWRYGRVDVETSKGQCADYVAKYVNGNCSLPRIYQQKETKPFALHSIHLGEMVLKKDREEIYRLPVREVVQRSVPLGSTITSVNLWRSLKTAYFPRCKNYALRNEFERLQAYRTYDAAKRIYDTISIVKQVDSILSDIVAYNEFYAICDINPFTDCNKEKERLIRYFIKSADINPCDLYTRESYDKYARKIYMELRLSRHFIDFCCSGAISETTRMYRKIESFWNEVDYLNLKHMYDDMEKFCDDWFEHEEDFQMFFSNVPHDMDYYKTTGLYNSLYWNVTQQYENSVKHKKLNDMNSIFADK